MQTIRKSKVITNDYTVSEDDGKIFVNTNNDITVTFPTLTYDNDVYVKNLGTGTTTIAKTNGIPVVTRSGRKIDGENTVTLSENTCLLLSYVKDLDKYFII
jgi:hypothetical protein